MWFRGVVDSGVRVEERIDRQALAKSCMQRSCLLRSLGKELHPALLPPPQPWQRAASSAVQEGCANGPGK